MTDIDFSDLIDELLGEESSEPSEPPATPDPGPAKSTLILIESTLALIDPASGLSDDESNSSDEPSSEELTVEPKATPQERAVYDPELNALRNWLDGLPHPMQKALLSRCGQLYAIVLEAQAVASQS
jgi:hypothetical protein